MKMPASCKIATLLYHTSQRHSLLLPHVRRLNVAWLSSSVSSHKEALVSPSWLKEELQNPSSKIRLLDAAWFASRNGEPAYLEKHIAGAQYYDVYRCTRPTQWIPRNIPDPDCYVEYLRSLGISSDDHVVVYDHDAMRGAARAWWTLRLYGHKNVSVLHGGLTRWMAEGHEVTDKIPATPPRGDISLKMQKNLLRSYEDIVENSKSRREQVVDVRKRKCFLGNPEDPAPEPLPSMRTALRVYGLPIPVTVSQGHIPGSVNIHVDSAYQEDEQTLKDPDEMEKLFASEGVDLTKPVTTLCYSGITASVMALAAAQAGKLDAAVYAGSWTEYCQRADQSQCVIDPPEESAPTSSEPAPVSEKRAG